MSSSKLAHDIVTDIIDELSGRSGIGNELNVIDTDIRDELFKTLEDIVDNQLEQAKTVNVAYLRKRAADPGLSWDTALLAVANEIESGNLKNG